MNEPKIGMFVVEKEPFEAYLRELTLLRVALILGRIDREEYKKAAVEAVERLAKAERNG